jgi:hypothetical protein
VSASAHTLGSRSATDASNACCASSAERPACFGRICVTLCEFLAVGKVVSVWCDDVRVHCNGDAPLQNVRYEMRNKVYEVMAWFDIR